MSGQDVSAPQLQSLHSLADLLAPGRNKAGSRATKAQGRMLGGLHLGPQRRGKPLPLRMVFEGDAP